MAMPVCAKCGGFLMLHSLDDTSHVVTAARCVNCGKIVDPVINTFQQLQAGGERKLKRRGDAARGKYR